MPDAEYDLILAAGFAHVLGVKDRTRPAPDLVQQAHHGFGELHQAGFEPEFADRRIISKVVQRPFRDRAFSVAIKTAYRDTCAVTGLKLINGGGRSEVEAAHIRPVADKGPDSIRNGIALSGTVHWMFDRGLISIDDNYSILVASGSVPDTAARLINPDLRLILPDRIEDRPHPQFLRHHHETVFKG